MRLAFVALATFSLCAQALQIVSLSPQGEVAQVGQVVVKFDEAAVNFGDPKAAAPITLACSDAQAGKGTGRWLNDREWVYDFEADLSPGVRCTAQVALGFKPANSQRLLGKVSYQFNTGGPFVKSIQPYPQSRIDEEQFFILQLNGAATPASVLANVWCTADGLGERVPVRAIEGADRAALLKSQGLEKEAAKSPGAFLTLACNRRLTPATRVQMVFGKGVATESGVANAIEKRFAYTVREPFTASFTCERENAQSACLPIRPLSLNFNAPVPRKLADGIRLKSESTTFKPVWSGEQNADSGDSVVNSVAFQALLPELAKFTVELPAGFKDASSRSLNNASSFPLKVATGAMPPLAKFAAAPFGIVERYAEPNGEALLPVTLRNVEAALKVNSINASTVSTLQPATDADIVAWFAKVQTYDNFSVPRQMAMADGVGNLPKVLEPRDKDEVQSRMVSLLQGQANVKTLNLPQPASADPRPFEVVGIPLPVGFHVVEIASPRLGQSLLDERHGGARTMYVRTSALVTNLGVHFKLGRENAAAWVTTLDKGQPVANASVQVSDCSGRLLAKATTNAQGLATFTGLSPQAPLCDDGRSRSYAQGRAYFVSARAPQAANPTGPQDMAFTWSDWHRGIEPWRFNVPTSQEVKPDEIAHTVLDRTLLRAGETVSMKHILRTQNASGFGLAATQPATLSITHLGSGQQYTQPLVWRKTATGGTSAHSSFAIPPAAKLGIYQIELRGTDTEISFTSGQFRVEEFRLPLLEGRIEPVSKEALINLKAVPLSVQVNYVAGGAAVGLPVRVSALVRSKSLAFADYDDFSFAAPRGKASNNASGDEENDAAQDTRVIADKLPITLDKTGAGKVALDKVPTARQPQDLLLEATYADPNGEVQTLRSTHTLWPAAVLAAIKTEGWVSMSGGARGKVKFQALALDLKGKPLADVPLQVNAVARIVTTSRKRMVGGFYTYDNKTEVKPLGEVCKGTSDSRGLLLCETSLTQAGEVELVVTAQDKAGNSIQAASSVYVTRQGELWFGGENHDRMDLLPEKKSYQPGETARFQVRMPFRFATALVAVEREGILETQVIQLNGQDPTVQIKVKDNWGPNVYVSVLALRGRLREVPWYSFFTWGYKAPREWWTSFWYEGREYVAPTALVDLSKPAFRLGLAEIRVGTQAHQLAVSVKADKDSYPVRGVANVSIQVKLPNGQPAANAEVALAAVDLALLELMPNNSWNLLDAMLQRRAWGVETSTAQMEIIGRRHYGRKAVPAGGGGGRSGTRELLDTLLLWNPQVQLDAKGEATVKVPLNDALTRFKIVAVADASTGLFGTGSTTITATQDLQIISGLPPLVREDDVFRAQFTLRNTTKAAMKVEVAPRATLLELKPQVVDIPPGEAREVAWVVTAPAQLAISRFETILWEIEARDTLVADAKLAARDALKARQRIVPAVPLTVQQATLVQVDGTFNLDVAPPADSLPEAGQKRGGLKMALQPKLAEGLPGVRDWFANYPFICLEQKTSKSVGLRDARLWQSVVGQIPGYLDADGLASYFPPREGEANRGSDTLTAYLLATTHEASSIDAAFALSDALRAPMERGLINFIEGKIQRDFWSPRKDLDVRKLAAMEALSRYGKAQARMLGSITIAPNQWPTHAVIDWLNILKRVADVPARDKRLAEANQILRSRLSFQGTKLIFSTEKDDYWWWLMVGGDVNTARLMLAVMDDPLWKDNLPRLANGFIGRQQAGAWATTTANLWGGLALEKFSAKFEATPVAGNTKALLASGPASPATVDWAKVERIKTTDASGAAHQSTLFGAPASPGNLRNNTLFLPWGKGPGKDTLTVTHQGAGKPWLTLQSVAAVQLKEPFSAGYQIKKTITPVEQANKALPAGSYTRGDVLRITLEVNASADMTWAVITDPIPAGATILGSGLGRDSQIATQGEKRTGAGWPAFEERSFESFRSYYEYLPKGVAKMEYTIRLNNVGEFSLPPSRAEAMYAPEMFGEAPNARVRVEAAK